MLNQQIMQAKIKLAETQKDFKENKINLMRIITELQNYCNPYFGDEIESIQAEAIEQAGDELLKVCKEALEQKKLIARIKSDIGEA